jgi:N-acetylmuramoyl-L-alanine amidase
MKRIFISAGHSAGSGAKDKGVPPTPFSKGKSEGELTLELRDRIVEDLKRFGIHAQTDLNKNALVETLAWIKNVFKSDKDSILIDIHFNAFNKVANGVEVIVPTGASKKETDIAKKIVDLLSGLGFKNRGVKGEHQTARKRLGWMRPIGHNILIEVCFMDNEADMNLYFTNIDIISKRITQAITTNWDN